MKQLSLEIKNSFDNDNDFYVLLNGKKANLSKTPQGRSGVIEVNDGESILEIRKKYYLDNPLGIFGVIFLWIKYLFSGEKNENLSCDGKFFYKFKMKFSLKADSQAKLYIVDKKNVLVNPVNCDIFSSTYYEVLENKSIINNKLPINYKVFEFLKHSVCIAIIGIFILLFIY